MLSKLFITNFWVLQWLVDVNIVLALLHHVAEMDDVIYTVSQATLHAYFFCPIPSKIYHLITVTSQPFSMPLDSQQS
jgi:hypothetical protein